MTTLLTPLTFTYIRLFKKIVSLFCNARARLKRFSFNLKYLVPLSLLNHCSSVIRDTRQRWNMLAVSVWDRHFVVEILVFEIFN